MISMKKNCFRLVRVTSLFLLLVAASLSFAGEWTIVGDIEGVPKRFQQLQNDGVISPDPSGQGWVLNEGQMLSFEGDLIKRGPYGIRTVRWVSDLLDKYGPERVRVTDSPGTAKGYLAMGNHDLNTASLIQWLPKMELGEFVPFNQWLSSKGRPNDLLSRIDYWAEWNGTQDKIEWFWLESVADKLGKDPLDPAFKARFFPEGRPLPTELEKVIPRKAAYDSFLDFVKPDGPLWKLYKKSQVIPYWTTTEGTSFLSFHSGNLTRGNFGVVPGTSRRYFDMAQLRDLPHSEASALAKQSMREWTRDYNGYINAQLDEVRANWIRLKGPDGKKAVRKSAEASAIADSLYRNRLASLSDAGWDPITKKLNIEANSLVYPDSRVVKGSSIPGLPEKDIIDALGLAEVDYVVSGHQPVGDGMIHRTGVPGRGRPVQFLLSDTSFSPVEQEDRVRVSDQGAIHFETKTRDGKNILIDRPGHKELDEWTKSVAEFEALGAEGQAKLPAEQLAKLKELQKKLGAVNKLGMMANGWLIIGFEGKPDSVTGKLVPDYDRFVLFQKQGRNMVYKTADIWGISAAKLEPAVADLDELARVARADKVTELKAHGQNRVAAGGQDIQILSTKDVLRGLKGKNVMLTSGPALNSLEKAKKNPAAAAMLTAHLDEFESWLRTIPSNEEWLFAGGGTQGFEQLRNERVAKVNAERVKAGAKPFEIFGFVTGVTGGSELDPNVKKYYTLNAFYWDDYLSETLKLIDNSSNRPKRLVFDYAGGGAIVTDQLRQTGKFISGGNPAEIRLIEGLTPYSPEGVPTPDELKKMAATDSFVFSEDGKTLIAEGKARVVRSGEYARTASNVDFKRVGRRTRTVFAGCESGYAALQH